jgi:Tripartite tricarboxylate transporter family receptor
VPQAENGKLTILAVATPQRMRQLPNVPTIGETYRDFSLGELERLSGSTQDSAGDYRQARKARDRRGA